VANNHKEIRISHEKIQDSQTISKVQREEFLRHGVNMSMNEVAGLEDDFKNKQRVIKVKGPKKYFFQGRGR
jgi:hypothetical protein